MDTELVVYEIYMVYGPQDFSLRDANGVLHYRINRTLYTCSKSDYYYIKHCNDLNCILGMVDYYKNRERIAGTELLNKLFSDIELV